MTVTVPNQCVKYQIPDEHVIRSACSPRLSPRRRRVPVQGATDVVERVAYRRRSIPQGVSDVDADPIQHREPTRIHVVLGWSNVSRDDAFNPITYGKPRLSRWNSQVFRDGRRNGFGPIAHLPSAIALDLCRFEKPACFRAGR